MYSVFLTTLRIGLGVALSLGMGYGAMLVSLLVVDLLVFSLPDLTIPSWMVGSAWFTCVGLLSGAGAYLAWMDEDRPRIDIPRLAVVLIAGSAGSWAGVYYGIMANRGRIFTDDPISGGALFAACFAANGAAVALAVIRRIRGERRSA